MGGVADGRAGAKPANDGEDGPDGGSWVIDGGKRFITNAGQAGTYIITARSGTKDDGTAEIDDLGFHVGQTLGQLQIFLGRGAVGAPLARGALFRRQLSHGGDHFLDRAFELVALAAEFPETRFHVVEFVRHFSFSKCGRLGRNDDFADRP